MVQLDADRKAEEEMTLVQARTLENTLNKDGYWGDLSSNLEHLGRNKRRTKSIYGSSRGALLQASEAVEAAMAAGVEGVIQIDPLTFEEAMAGPDAVQWRTAMDKEYDTVTKMRAWKDVPLPPGRKIVESRWVYKTKLDYNGQIEKYKARFVAKGFSQVLGVDYFDTNAPVCKLVTIRLLIAVATFHKWHIRQSDVTNAYLHANLDEEHKSPDPLVIYVRQPKGYVRESPTHVLEVSGNLYGTKQGKDVECETKTSSH